MEIEIKYKNKIIGILSVLFPNAKIYLFGSRARKTNRKFSDIDIALDEGNALNPIDVGEARDMLSESNIPYKIDIVDLNNIPKEMHDAILTEGILWKN